MPERPGFLKVPHALLDAAPEVLTHGQLLVLLRIMGDCQWEPAELKIRGRIVQLDAGEALTGTRNLAGRCHLTRDTVRRAFDRLRAVGWVTFKPAWPLTQDPPLPHRPSARKGVGAPPPTVARVTAWRAIQWPDALEPAPTPETVESPSPPAQDPPRSKTETELQARKEEKGNGALDPPAEPRPPRAPHFSPEELELEAAVLSGVSRGRAMLEVASDTGKPYEDVAATLKRCLRLELVRDGRKGPELTRAGRQALESARALAGGRDAP